MEHEAGKTSTFVLLRQGSGMGVLVFFVKSS